MLKKIFHIGGINKNLGGVARYINLINGVQFKTISNIIICSDNPEDEKIIKFDFRYNFFTIFYKIYLLKKIIKRKKIKYFHVHTQKAALLVCLLKFLSHKIYIIYTPHGFRHTQVKNFKKFFHFCVELLILLNVEKIILISKYEVFNFKNNWLLKCFNFTYIPTAIPLPKKKKIHNLKKNYKINKNSKVIICIANLEKIKQPDLFFAIAKNVIKNNLNTTFIYFGKCLDRRYRKFFNKDKRIIFAGYVDHLILEQYLSQVDFYLNTSELETKSFSILESLSFGIPVICNGFEGSSELIKKNKTGFIYNFNNLEHASFIINNILNKKCFIKKKVIIDNFKKISNFSSFKKKYIKLYDKI